MIFRKTICTLLSAVVLAAGAGLMSDQYNDTGITANAARSSISFQNTSLSIGWGEKYKLSIKNSAKEKIEWTSSDSTKVYVRDGVVGGKNKGTAIITAKTGSGAIAKCLVTVKSGPISVAITKKEITLGVGESYTVGSSIGSGSASAERTYSSDNDSIVHMTNTRWTGKFIAKKPGVTYVRVRTYNGREDRCKVTVKNAPKKVTLTKGVLTLGAGESYTLGSGLDEGAASADRTFRSSNKNVVMMTNTKWTGKFTAKAPGTAYVTVRTYNGKEASCKVTVKKAPTKVKLSKELVTLGIGESCTLTSSLSSGAASSVRLYRSSNSNIVKMTKTSWTGEFTAKKVGTAYVTVRTYNGLEASCKVVVKASPDKLTLNREQITLRQGKSAVLTASVPANTYSSVYTFNTGSSGVIKLTPSGNKCVVKALKKGTAYVNVRTYNGKTASCKVAVK